MASVKDKIKKLLALSQSPNENEARDALLKAKEFMAKYKLSEDDFEGQDAELRHVIYEDIKWTTDSGNIWMAELCQVIAENYCCVAAWRTRRGTRTHTLQLTGMGEDVDLCKEVIKYAIDFIFGRIRILEKKSINDRKAVTQSYTKGFILGLELAFEEQEEEHPEWGLVVVKSEEVKNFEDSLSSKSVRTKKANFDPLAYIKGQTDGTNFNPRKVIGAEI